MREKLTVFWPSTWDIIYWLERRGSEMPCSVKCWAHSLTACSAVILQFAGGATAPSAALDDNLTTLCKNQQQHIHCQSHTHTHRTHFWMLYDYFITIIVVFKYKGDQELTLCFDTPLYLCINRKQMVLNSIVLYCKLIEQTAWAALRFVEELSKAIM